MILWRPEEATDDNQRAKYSYPTSPDKEPTADKIDELKQLITDLIPS